MNKRNKRLKRALTIVVASMILLLTGYVVYVKASIYRQEDALALSVDRHAEDGISTEAPFSVMTYNIGMGIYSADFGFFMDGGKAGRAKSPEEVLKNTNGAISTLMNLSPDFIFLEEAGVNCTCNYHINQLEMLRAAFPAFDSVYAQNWDSPYFAYPIFKPFGKSVAGLSTFSKYRIDYSTRYSLPIEDSFTNFVDLDRCYTKSVVHADTERDLILYCIHASAYTKTAETANNQIKILMGDMLGEYEKGNYVIAGGDWNRCVDGDPEILYGTSVEGRAWLSPLNRSVLPESFIVVSGIDEEHPVPSGRNADGPYDPSTQAQGNIDGFIISDNLTLRSAHVVDTGFAYSDHNPVYMELEFIK